MKNKLLLLFAMLTSISMAWATDYYLVGSTIGWATDDNYKLTYTAYVDAYTLTTTLPVCELKVLSSASEWYPGGTDNNYKVQSAGTYTIYFKPEGGVDGWYCGYFKVEAGTLPEPVLTGDGSAESPYQIATDLDWKIFAYNVNTIGATYSSGKYFKLTADINASTMVGTSDKKFAGIFDGDGHTLTFSMVSTEQYVAPFRYIIGATIQNLKVAGTVTSSNKFAGGIVAHSTGANVITNCVNSTVINASIKGNGSHGGIVGQLGGNGGNSITISGCLFDGKMLGDSTDYWCGIIGYYGSHSVTISDCLFYPAEISVKPVNNNFTMCRAGASSTVSNCYYNTAAAVMHEKRGKQPRSINAGIDVDGLTISGASTVYNVSGITGYSTGIRYNDVLYAGDGDEVSLTITHDDKAGYVLDRYTVSGGGSLTNQTETGATLTMTDADQTISAEWKLFYYLVGDMSGWNVDANYQLQPNTESEGEYFIQDVKLFNGKKIKVVSSYDSSTKETWFPAANNSDYTLSDDGIYTIYFRPEGNVSGWHHGYFYVQKTAEAPVYYYLIGLNGWTVNDNYKMTLNTAASAEEYMFTTDLTTSNPFKVVSSVDEVNVKNWYPSNGANYGENGEITSAGNYTIYFRPGGNMSGWHGGYFCVIKNVTLVDNANNSDAITAANNQKAHVTLSGRTLYKDGDWNTLCLPFDLDDFTGTPLEGATVMQLGNSQACNTGFDPNTGTLSLDFIPANAIEAGVAYIVKWDVAGEDIVDPVFTGVTVAGEAPADHITVSEDGRVQFIGTYTPALLTANTGANLYLGTANQLHYPTADNYYLNAFRAYFTVDLGGASAPSRIVLNFGEEQTTTDMQAVEQTPTAVKFIQDGSLYILRDGILYDAMGKMVKHVNK